MMRGTVRMWDPTKGFGFIAVNSRDDVYFNRALVANITQLPSFRMGAEVTFEMKKLADGRVRAIGVELASVSRTPEPAAGASNGVGPAFLLRNPDGQ